jgi:hypothetical protein
VRSGVTCRNISLLTRQYFGLRRLVGDHEEWTTAQIVEAYRGQSKLTATFRDLNDLGVLATRPQFHSTDQKLHALLCVRIFISASAVVAVASAPPSSWAAHAIAVVLDGEESGGGDDLAFADRWKR